MEFFISAAYAQDAAAQSPSVLFNLFFIGGMFVLFYLILWRPQSKRAKEHKNLVGGLAKGDEVLTSGGLLGKITKVTDDYVTLQVTEGVDLCMQKSSIAAALPKGTIKSIQ